MKAVLLAGGLGTRLSEETQVKPKPMVEIGHRPILWHIMKTYTAFGITDFIICLGYRGHLIKEYFANYFLYESDITFNMSTNQMEVHSRHAEPWRVTLVDTGLESMTGGRLRRVREHIGDETFCFTYGDGVSDVDIAGLIAFHRAEGRLATMTAVKPPGRFGVISLPQDQTAISSFREKKDGDEAWINGGFFVLEPEVIDFIEGDLTVWEQEPLTKLAAYGQLSAFRHNGFWQPMDTLRDKKVLEGLWNSKQAPWKVW
ncbi:MAG: glucose-1-phosphate cytidylyltransferase [Gloeobacterales cyanobacterium]